MHHPKYYLAALVGSTLLAGFTAYYGLWFAQITDCLHRPIAGTFMAYCQNQQFGDFEHSAFMDDLQSEAIGNAKKADVLFLGSSVIQFATASPVTNDFFAREQTSFYSFGFGYVGQGAFFDRLEAKYSFQPKVLVISVDPFFSSLQSVPAMQSDSVSPSLVVDRYMKAFFDLTEGLVCRVSACDGAMPVLFRRKDTGQWSQEGMYIPGRSGVIPVSETKKFSFSEEDARNATPMAKQYLSRFHTPKECIILTGVPNSLVPAEKIARLFSASLGLQAILPDVPGLSTFDEHHLDPKSASRWTSAFLSEAEPIIRRCIDHPM